MIVIGADPHKSSHALAVVDAAGLVVGELEITADQGGYRQALVWAQGLGEQRVWAIEDCRHVSASLERMLIAAGERVIRVAPKLVGQSRRGERTRGKSDQIDARAVAHAVLRDGVERFPAAYLDERALDIRLLNDHRSSLVAQRTAQINQLRWHLVSCHPELEAQIPAGRLDQTKTLDRIARVLRSDPHSVRTQVALELLKSIRSLSTQTKALTHQLEGLVSAYAPQLLSQQGCGVLSAATLVGHTGGAQRFATDAQFARHAGVAPIPVSSGRTDRHRLDRGGNRQLNRALHVIAITRARLDPQTRAYLDRKRHEGKTHKEALRCLKRQLARHFHRLLTTPPNQPPPTPLNTAISAPCLT
jgi:transposase